MKHNSQKGLAATILIFILSLMAGTAQPYSTTVNAANTVPNLATLNSDNNGRQAHAFTIFSSFATAGIKPGARSAITVIPSPDEFSWKGGTTDITIMGQKFSPFSLVQLEIDGQIYTADYIDSTTFTLNNLLISENGTSIVKAEPITVYLDKVNLGILANIKINPKQPGMDLKKTIQKKLNEYQVGDQVIYEIIVTNTGDCDLTNINITDSLDPSWNYTIPLLSEGSFESVTFSYTIQPLDSGSVIINRAECSSHETGKTVSFDEESIQVKNEPTTGAPTSPTVIIPTTENSSSTGVHPAANGNHSSVLVKTDKTDTTEVNTTAPMETSKLETEHTIPPEQESSKSDEKEESSETWESLESSSYYISEIPQTGGNLIMGFVYLSTAAAALFIFLLTIRNAKTKK